MAATKKEIEPGHEIETLAPDEKARLHLAGKIAAGMAANPETYQMQFWLGTTTVTALKDCIVICADGDTVDYLASWEALADPAHRRDDVVGERLARAGARRRSAAYPWNSWRRRSPA
jgi:hypothetical protein